MHEDLRLPRAERQGFAEERHQLLPFVANWRLLMDLLQMSHDCVILRGKDRGVMFWNRAAEQLYGWTQSEAQGQIPEALLKTQFPRNLNDIESELQSNGYWEGELIHSARDGRRLVVASRWSLQIDADQRHLGILQIERDLTENRHLQQSLSQTSEQRLEELGTANEALVESQARLHQIGEAIHDVVWLSNPRRTSTIYVNPAYEQIWGRSCQALYADPQSWLEGVHPEDRPRLRQFFAKGVSEKGYQQSYRLVRADCSVRWVLDRGFCVRDDSGAGYRVVGIVRDVTERKELMKEIVAISEREQRRIGQDLHDDLCQQLVGIEFLSRALQEQLGVQPQSANAGEIAKLIRQAINYTRQLAKGLAPVELTADGLQRSLQALAGRISELCRVRCSLECPSTFVIQDPVVSTHLYRIAQEAVANSVKHGQATQIKIALTLKPDGGELAIEDNGRGLPDEAHVSSGMGLRTMRYRSDMIGGTFVARTGVSGGTRIVCSFPLTTW